MTTQHKRTISVFFDAITQALQDRLGHLEADRSHSSASHEYLELWVPSAPDAGRCLISCPVSPVSNQHEFMVWHASAGTLKAITHGAIPGSDTEVLADTLVDYLKEDV